jgi:LmbE family N-acetylglucosaminyl deacetylase
MVRTLLPAILVLGAAPLLGLPAPAASQGTPSGPGALAGPAAAQGAAFGPGATTGTTELALLLRQLDAERRVLMIAAHPDDEDTALLTTLARGMGARTAYLSLTRGEGGQNLIGPELDEGLGLIRTGELLSARALDGASQYFSRAFDFGFSRRADETFDHWGEEEILSDMVRLIRTLRPQVIVSVFHGTDQDGHGHHQASGILAHRAFEVAADATWEDGLEPWSATTLYRLLWRGGEPDLELPTGTLDPLLGRSHYQVAMASRSRHRSQDMGTAEPLGARSSRLQVAAHRGTGDPAATGDFFSGVETSLLALAEHAGGGMAISRSLAAWSTEIARAREALHPEEPGRALAPLADARLELEASIQEVERSAGSAPDPASRAQWLDLHEALLHRQGLLSEALGLSAGAVVELRVDRPRAAPGEEVEVEVLVWNGGSRTLRIEGVTLDLPSGWPTPEMDAGGEVAPGEVRVMTARLRIPSEARSSLPHFLLEPRDGSRYPWPQDRPELWSLPADPPPVAARVALSVEDARGRTAPLSVRREARHVSENKAVGEETAPFFVVPALSVSTLPASLAWPAHQTDPRAVEVQVENLSASERRGEVRLEAPAGWTVEPRAHPFSLDAGASVTTTFQVRPEGVVGDANGAADPGGFGRAPGGGAVPGGARAPDGTGPRGAGAHGVTFQAMATDQAGGAEYRGHFRLVSYPHIDPLPLETPATLGVSRFPVAVRQGIRVGYVVGPGESGFRALEDLGVEVTSLDPGRLASTDLSASFDVVVLGERAYETRTDLPGANARILAFAEAGGTVVVQYNKYEYPEGEFAPFPLAMARPHDRITDPEAPVTFLDPEHPLLAGPNRITPDDFRGWVQERGLYFLSEWDPRYTPLLEMQDPEMAPVRGGLVVARVGEGAYVYTGLAFFRQFPRGVPGAFRLLANMVSLQGSDLE